MKPGRGGRESEVERRGGGGRVYDDKAFFFGVSVFKRERMFIKMKRYEETTTSYV